MDIYASTARAARCVKPHRSDAAIDSAPGIFDAATYPIIGEHFFGIEPFRPIGHVAAEIVADLRRQRQIEHIHRLGARAVSELLYEVAEGEDLDRALDAYSRLTPGLLKALGGDRFPPAPIHEVQT